MSLLRLSSRNHLLPFLQHSRCAAEVQLSNYKYTGACTSYSGVWGLLPRCGYGTNMINRNRKIQSFGSACLWKSNSFSSIQQHYASHSSTEQKSRKMLLYLTALVFAMVGSSYAAVPLYRRFCQATGYGGTVQLKERVEEKIARHANDGTVTTREIVVQFNADVADGLPWNFIPTQREVRVKPGESALAFYTAEN